MLRRVRSSAAGAVYCVVTIFVLIGNLVACGPITPLASSSGDSPSEFGLRDFDLGLQAELNGDYAAARDAYLRALAAASSVGADSGFVADITYNLGRMSGYLCDFRTAEAMLQQSLRLVESRTLTMTPAVSRRLFELGRLAIDEDRFVEAVAFFERALPVLENLKMVAEDPLGFAYVLDELAYALDGAGQTDRAVSVRLRSSELREKSGHAVMQFRPKHFAQGCAETSTNRDWPAAHQNWSVMVKFASKVDTPIADYAEFLFEHGRALGVLCDFSEAERNLRQAQYYFDRINGPGHLVLVELARLNLAQKRYLSALTHFDEIFKRVANDDLGEIEPGWYEKIANEYADALSAVGRDALADEKRNLLHSDTNQSPRVNEYRTPYGSQCTESDSGIMG